MHRPYLHCLWEHKYIVKYKIMFENKTSNLQMLVTPGEGEREKDFNYIVDVDRL